MSERSEIVAAIYPEGMLRPAYERDWRRRAEADYSGAVPRAVESIAKIYRRADEAMRAGDARAFNALSLRAGRRVETLNRRLERLCR